MPLGVAGDPAAGNQAARKGRSRPRRGLHGSLAKRDRTGRNGARMGDWMAEPGTIEDGHDWRELGQLYRNSSAWRAFGRMPNAAGKVPALPNETTETRAIPIGHDFLAGDGVEGMLRSGRRP